MKQTILLLALVILTSLAYSQTNGSLSGYVFSDEDKLPIPGVQVYVETPNGKSGTVTDSLGHFTIKPLNPGRYNLVISYVGYTRLEITNINVRGDFETNIGKKILKVGETLTTCVIDGGTPKLIDEAGGNIIFMSPKQQQNLPSPSDLAMVMQAMSTEFFVSDDKSEIHFRGSRNDMTAYLIDGMRVDALTGVPRFAIGSMTIYAGGIPAKYGDFTGGVVVVETLGYFDWLSMAQARDRLLQETTIKEETTVKEAEVLEVEVEENI